MHSNPCPVPNGPRPSPTFRYLLACLCTAPFAADAQPAVPAVDSERVFELSPFVVQTTDDRGYRSTNTTSGTSLNIAIRDLPIPIDVINREMLDDLQASNMEESLQYSAGVFTQSFQSASTDTRRFEERSPSAIGDINSPFQNAVSIRGYQVPNQQRMGFRIGGIMSAYGVVLGGNTDTITTERTEVVRGPQSLLYGINVLSGIVNIIPKRPLAAPATTLGFGAGSRDYVRGTVDSTGPVMPGRLNYRLLGAYHEEGHHIQFRNHDRRTTALQFDARISPRISLFVEALDSKERNRGIGRQFFTDDGSGGRSNFTWRNPYGEFFVYGRDDPTVPVIDQFGARWENYHVPVPGRSYDFTDLGANYNISGPDTRLDRRERSYLGLLTITPTRDLSIELGAYRVELEQQEFNVDMQVFTNSRGAIIPSIVPNSPVRINRWVLNPEVAAANALADPYGYGVGEPFAFPVLEAVVSGYETGILYTAPTPQNLTTLDRKFARYAWFERPSGVTTQQFRGRIAYRLEADFFKVPAVHNFSAGYHFIGDRIHFITGAVSVDNDAYIYSSAAANRLTAVGREAHDPVYFRSSVFDFTPLRYQGETIGMPGRKRFASLGGVPESQLHVARSGWREADLDFTGIYGVYQGQFWADRLTVIGGVRHDSYFVREREFLTVVDRDRTTDQWVGNNPPTLPVLIGFGDQPYVWRSDISEALNQKVAQSIDLIRINQPNGTRVDSFPETQKFTTGTFGLNYRATDAISFYALYSEGVFPNSGQRDGNYNPVDAEQTVNHEIGAKFDFFDGKLSGTVSVYRIRRQNAVTYWDSAPAPSMWHGGELGPINRGDVNRFSPQAATGPGSDYFGGLSLPLTYGVSVAYVKAAFDALGMPFPLQPGELPSQATFAPYGSTGAERKGALRAGLSYSDYFINVAYATLTDDPNAAVLRKAFELAMAGEPINDPVTGIKRPYFGDPISWGGTNVELNNATLGSGANVTFEEEGTGFDTQLIWSPVSQFQVMFSYSYQKREIVGRGFNLLDAIDPQTGVNWGTEFDRWVYVLGVENFEDPTRPSTYNGDSVRGLDLSFVPRQSFRTWSKYRFLDGFLAGLDVGGGVQFNGSAPTAAAIGGIDFVENRYPTPPTASHYEFDAFANYTFHAMRTRFVVSLKIANLLNTTERVRSVTYTDELGVEFQRRTVSRYTPRSWRLAISASF
jgi:outer membrane receptor protein involved in Fe transport